MRNLEMRQTRKFLVLSQTQMTVSGIIDAYGQLVYVKLYKKAIDDLNLNVRYANTTDVLKEETMFTGYFN